MCVCARACACVEMKTIVKLINISIFLDSYLFF